MPQVLNIRTLFVFSSLLFFAENQFAEENARTLINLNSNQSLLNSQAEFFGAEAGRGPPYTPGGGPGDPGDPLYHPGPPPPPGPPPGGDFVRASSDVQYVQYYKNGGAGGGGGGAHLSPDSGIGGESAVVASE